MANILVIEDYNSLQNIYATVLTMEGHTVEVSDDGRDALAKTAEHHYDLIILDMLLKEMNGLDFLRQFNQKKHSKTKIIAFSNIVNPRIMKDAVSLGVSRYLTKATYSPKAMVAIINEVLEGK